jgi:hypothetical protein
MHRKPLLVPKLAFITAWEWEGHGPPPAVIGLNETWMSPETKREFEDKVLATLTKLGLATGGMLTRDFRDVLAALANGNRQYTGWAGDISSDEAGGILVSIHGDRAVRVLRDDELVRIDQVPAEYAAESLVDVLPILPPAAIDPIAIPKSQYSPDGAQRAERFDFVMPDRYAPRDPTARARTLMAAQRSGIHQLYAGNGHGRRSSPITVVDVIGEGRVLTYVSAPPREEPRINFLPGTKHNIVGALYNS